MCQRNRLIALLITAAAVAVPAPASAEVLWNVPDSPISLGQRIKTGVMYDSLTGGSRRALIQILSYRKRLIASRRVRAIARRWNFYYYRPGHRRTYYVRYRVATGTFTYRVRVV